MTEDQARDYCGEALASAGAKQEDKTGQDQAEPCASFDSGAQADIIPGTVKAVR